MNKKLYDDFAESLSHFIPAGMDTLKADFEQNIKAALQSLLNKMDLVTREDFEAQQLLLERTREELHALQAQITELEERSKQSDNP